MRTNIRVELSEALWVAGFVYLIWYVTAEVGELPLRFVHRDNLIRMKLAASRERDLQDIAALTSGEGREAGASGRPE